MKKKEIWSLQLRPPWLFHAIFFLYVREESTNIYLRNIQPFCHRVHIFVFPFVVSNNLYRWMHFPFSFHFLKARFLTEK